MTLLAIALSLSAQAPAVVRVELRQSGDRCIMRIGDRSVDPLDEKAVAALLSPYDAKRHRIEIIGDESLTYRCIGGVVYRLQSLGFDFAKSGIQLQPPVQ